MGAPLPPFRPNASPFRWEGVDVLAYKEDGSAPFKSVTRQTLFSDPSLSGELRYFEVAPGGHTTLERHHHAHGVMVLRGQAKCLVFPDVRDIAQGDLVFIPPLTWHQFQTLGDEPFGFLCLVNADRDRPQLPTERDLEDLRHGPGVSDFLASAGL